MSSCTHKTLVLLREVGGKLRCRRCHLVISPQELNGGFCPECYEADRRKCFEFDAVPPPEGDVARYRCESCGALIEWKGTPAG